MLGAIIGDISGSRFEWINIKSKKFELLAEACRITDDSVMTLAVADTIMRSGGNTDSLFDNAAKCMREYGRRYPRAGYGGMFFEWLHDSSIGPYNSFGNGAAMRVSPCAYASKSLEEAISMSEIVTSVTHNHPQGIKGAEAVTAAIFMARQGRGKDEIKQYINDNYYPLDFTLDEIRPAYKFDVTCKGSVPQAIRAFVESTGFEDAIRNAISIGGDSDTIAAITGSIAEAYYGIPDDIRQKALTYLDNDLIDIINEFEAKYQ